MIGFLPYSSPITEYVGNLTVSVVVSKGSDKRAMTDQIMRG